MKSQYGVIPDAIFGIYEGISKQPISVIFRVIFRPRHNSSDLLIDDFELKLARTNGANKVYTCHNS
jgi:hypothetical protein